MKAGRVVGLDTTFLW